MKIAVSGKDTIVASDCRIADNFFTRFRGLMGKKSLEQGSGLLITPCNSIHMFFMKFPIDAVFIDRGNNVLYIAEAIRPWKVSKIISGAHSVLELPAGTAKLAGVKIGDNLEMHNG